METKHIDRIHELASERADAHELLVSQSNSISIGYDKGKLTDIQQKGSLGAGLRVAKGGTLGFSVSTKLDAEEALVDSALRLAPYGGPHDFTFAPKAESSAPSYYDAAVSDMSPDRLLSLGTDARDLMKELAPEASFMGKFGVSWGNSWIRTSEGQSISEREGGMSMYVGAELIQEGDFLTALSSRSSIGVLSRDTIMEAVREAASDFNDAREAAACPAGKYRILISPSALSDFLTPVKVNVNGINVEKKISRWIEERGQRVFDSRISIYDDPTLEDGVGSSAYDGEGTPTARRALIEDGVLQSFVHSRSTAAHTGEEPTGNGARGVSSVAKPGLHNLVMSAGDQELATLIEQANGGVWMEDLIGVFTSNFLAGQVSGSINLGYRIEDSKRIGRVKNAAFNVNAFDLFSGRILGISKQRKWVGSQLLPWLLVEDVAISSR